MKKSLLSVFFAFFLFLISSAENLEIYYEGELVTDTLCLTDYNEMFGEITFEAIIKNNSDRDVHLALARETILAVDSSSNFFCWAENCWPSDMDTCNNTVTIPSGGQTNPGDFSAHYSPMGHEGTTIVKYTFWDPDSPEFTVSVVVKYKYNNTAGNNLELIYEGEVVSDTLILNDYNPAFGDISFEANIKNNTDRDVNLYLARENISVVDSTQNYFCWAGSCWPADLDSCNSTQNIPAGEMTGDGEFTAHYMPYDHKGTSIVKYTFWDDGDASINLSVVVKYVYGTDGINDNDAYNVVFSDVYPNPATDFIHVDYTIKNSQDAYLVITNLLGVTVKTEPLSKANNTLELNISDLSQGVYFYTIVSGQKIMKAKKLVVK